MKSEPSNEPWYAVGDPWVLTQTEWSPEKNIYFETIFTQSNGYMGIRGYTEEVNAGLKSYREGCLAGVFGHVDEAGQKLLSIKYPWPSLQMVSLPELFSCAIVLNDEPFAMSEGTIEFFSRTLNMRNGMLSRSVVWVSPRGHRTRLQFERFLSASNIHLAMQQITVKAENWSGKAALHFSVDGEYPTYFRCGDRAMPNPPQHILQNARIDSGRYGSPNVTVEVKGTGHTVGMAFDLGGDGRVVTESSGKVLAQGVELSLQAGKSATVLHSLAVVSSRDGVEPGGVSKRASEIARAATHAGFDASLAESESVWQRRWTMSDIAIDGPARDQAYIRFSAFSMLQMAPFHTDTMSIPARAYAFNRYHGLYYWDSETFLLPSLLHTHPEVAENLLGFRYRTLDGARRTARRLESSGACYPWMTDSDDGAEQAPWGIGDYVWHQNADIAYAIDQYVQATGNTRFLVEKGLEVLLETARFWMSRLEQDARGVVHLHNTVGPDELDKHGKDNGYTSLMARNHLRLAAHWLEKMRAEYPEETKKLVEKLEVSASETAGWIRSADRMAVPNVPGHNFPLQDEFLVGKKHLSFEGLTADEAFAKRHTHQVVKQADIILAMFLLQDEFTIDQMRDAYDYYEPMCLHYSSLSYNTHSILATKIGRNGQAYDYFMKAAGLDLDNLRDATKDGLHAAALGGTWQTIVYGFLGMRIAGAKISFEPRIPEAWKTVSLNIIFRGYRLKMRLNHNNHRIEVDATEGRGPAELVLNGEVHPLSGGRIILSSPKALK